MKRHPLFFRALALLLILTLWAGPATAQIYTTLEYGSKGTDVLKLQQSLTLLGFDPGTADGKFGRTTEKAVKLYQQSRGLKADGKAGTLTLTKLYAEADGSGVAAGSAVTTATSTNPNTLKFGDTGDRVKALQTALRQLGYLNGSVDGKFGTGTRAAVIQFQSANGLTVDGLAGSSTQALLLSLTNGAAGTGPSSASTPATGWLTASTTGSTSASVTSAVLSKTLRRGATGTDVTSVQSRLAALGYYTGSIDGVYGSGTIVAVKKFQLRNGLKNDGLVGAQTYAKLMASDAVASAAVIASGGVAANPSTGSGASSGTGSSSGTSNAGSSGSTSGNSTGSSTSTTTAATTKLQLGDAGTAVKTLQAALKNLGYAVTADGTYGPITVAAVTAFQQQNGLTVDGIAGSKTQTLLYSGSAKAASAQSGTSSSGTTASSGSSGSGATVSSGSASSSGSAVGPNGATIQLLHWFNDVKPSVRTGQTYTVYDPATNLQWNLRFYSLGRHADSEPLTAEDTATMFKAFGNKNTWTPKPVYVKLPTGVWTLATMHNVPHLSGSIKDNDFDGHLCVHFLRDMDECKQNDPNYGVTNQNAIRAAWKKLTGITVD